MKTKDQFLLEQAYENVHSKFMPNQGPVLKVIFHANYNGWTISNNDPKLEEALGQFSARCYDEDGNCHDTPDEQTVRDFISKYYNKPTNIQYSIDEHSS